MNALAPLARDAAARIAAADGILVAAGAGMGVDSGLPDFRGPQGFWRAYPALGRRGLHFQDIACPDAFHDTPELAWGFYGHRLALYRATVPHAGFDILRTIAQSRPHGAFVFTSNVDGQFRKAGFADERIEECHGSIHWLQCLTPCSPAIWPAQFEPVVDDKTCLLISPLPRCPDCGGLARPNILMFGDWQWQAQRAQGQALQYRRWRATVERLVVIELGAGTGIPSVRHFSEQEAPPGGLIRINPREPQLPDDRAGVSSAAGAEAALRVIGDARGGWPTGGQSDVE